MTAFGAVRRVFRGRWGRHAVAGLRFGLALVLLWLALRDVPYDSILPTFRQVDLGWLAVVVGLVLIGLGVKAWRWLTLLRPILPHIRWWEVLGILTVGQAGNMLLPARAGDVMRTLLASKSEGRQIPAVVTGLALEKGTDGLVLLGAAAFLLQVVPGGPWLNGPTRESAGLVLLVLGAAAAALLASRSVWLRLRQVLVSRSGWLADNIVQLGDRFVEGMDSLRHRRVVLRFLILTLAAWLVMWSVNVALGVSLRLAIPPSAGLLLVILILIGRVPGWMPGQIGPFYFFTRLGLQQYGIGGDAATGYAILLHLCVFAPPLLGACGYLLFNRAQREELLSRI